VPIFTSFSPFSPVFMQSLYLKDSSDRRGGGGGALVRKAGGSGLFWWTILITLLMGLVTFCWFFSIMLFKHPEKPMNYRLLGKLEKLPLLRKFTVYTAPSGTAMSARELLTAYYHFEPEQLLIANDLLKRSYIRNYEKEDPPVYVTGSFEILEVRPLTEEDVFTAGWVARTRSVDLEDVDVEIVLPGLGMEVPPFVVGETLQLDRRNTCATLLHVVRPSEDRLCATVVPIVYEGIKATSGDTLSFGPPRALNMDAGWPLTTEPNTLDKAAIGAAVPLQ
jgi:hypothetical protein